MGCEETVRGLAAVLILVACASCAGMAPPSPRPNWEEQGGLFIYLAKGSRSPTSGEGLAITNLAAVQDDGFLVPLSTLSAPHDKTVPDSERLLAWGTLPPGRYSGLSFRWSMGNKSLLSDSGEPLLVTGPFNVARRRAAVLSLNITWSASGEGETGLIPAFSAFSPAKPAPALIALASCRGSNHLAVFDKLTGKIAGIIPLGQEPEGIALREETHRAFIAESAEDAIDLVDLLENAVIERLRLTGGDDPADLALTGDHRILLCVNRGSGTVSFIDSNSLSETTRIQVGQGPESMVVDAFGRRAYVFNTRSNTISVLDVPGQTVVRTIPTESGPFRGQLDRSGNRLFVIHESSPYLSVINLPAFELAQKVYVGPGARALAVDQRSGRIYLSRSNTPAVDVYDPVSFMPVDSIPVGGEVTFLAIDAESGNLYPTMAGDGQVHIINLVSRKVVAVVDVGYDPVRVAFFGRP